MIILKGHALDLIDEVGTFDLLVTDPPYAFGGTGGEHALSATVCAVLRESAKKLHRGGWAVVFAASSWRSTYYMVESMRGLLDPVRIGTWCKPKARTKVRTPGWAWASVNVIVFKRPGDTGAGSPSSELDYIVAEPLMVGRRAQLPDEVAEWAVRPFATSGAVAFDPFAGSGALLKAAEMFGMTAIGCEVKDSGMEFVRPDVRTEHELLLRMLDETAWLGPVQDEGISA